MPKRRQKFSFTNSAAASYRSPTSSRLGDCQNVHPSSSSADQASVNELIDHLRRTQVSSRGPTTSCVATVASHSVHPALRDVLEVPETPPPRPRHNVYRAGIGGRRLRPTPGPPPPDSWLVNDSSSRYNHGSKDQYEASVFCIERKIIDRLERLPGMKFPAQDRLLHLALKSMALNWMWHVEYDGRSLGLLPSRIKMLLLSYIAIYSRSQTQYFGQQMRGLEPLYQQVAVDSGEYPSRADQRDNLDIFRLDLGFALGRWLTLKQVMKELIVLPKSDTSSAVGKGKDVVPSSWEDAYADDDEFTTVAGRTVPKSLRGLRFENLRFLSLAHPNPDAVNWSSLISLLSYLSTLTHLSLAYWPVPTLAPNAIGVRVQHPSLSSLSFPYSGTDTYAAFENNWAEAASVLRKLSRATYCLEWLDMEGCDWIPALSWEDFDDEGDVYNPGSFGPEWNRSWRNIEFVRLGPGWLPCLDVDGPLSSSRAEPIVSTSESSPVAPMRFPLSRSLSSSIHPSCQRPALGIARPSIQDQRWDVEKERIKYHRSKELESFRKSVDSAKAVQKHILNARRQARGRWIRFSFGLEELAFSELRRLFGQDYMSFVL